MGWVGDGVGGKGALPAEVPRSASYTQREAIYCVKFRQQRLTVETRPAPATGNIKSESINVARQPASIPSLCS